MVHLTQPKCGNCGRIAVLELRNHRNESVNKYCRNCGKSALAHLKDIERRDFEDRLREKP
jgi:hypothetical protein